MFAIRALMYQLGPAILRRQCRANNVGAESEPLSGDRHYHVVQRLVINEPCLLYDGLA